MRRRAFTNRKPVPSSCPYPFHLQQESAEANEAKAILMESYVDYAPASSTEGLTSWIQDAIPHPIFLSFSGSETLRNSCSKDPQQCQSANFRSKMHQTARAQVRSKQAPLEQVRRTNFIRRNLSHQVKPSSAPVDHKTNLWAEVEPGQLSAQTPVKKSQSHTRRNETSLLSAYLLEHLYKKKQSRMEEMMAASSAKAKALREMRGKMAGMKGQREIQSIMKSQMRLLE